MQSFLTLETGKPFVLFFYHIQNISNYIRPITEKSCLLLRDFQQSQVTELISIGRLSAEFEMKWKIPTISKKHIKLVRSAICIYIHSHTQSVLDPLDQQSSSYWKPQNIRLSVELHTPSCCTYSLFYH